MNHSLGPQRKGAKGETECEGETQAAAGGGGGGDCSKGNAVDFFLAHPQKQEVSRREPRGAQPVSSEETGVGFGIGSRPPLCAPRLIGSASRSL